MCIRDSANSYVSISDATAFYLSRGYECTTEEVEALLLQAMDILNILVYHGNKTVPSSPLPFPRQEVMDQYGVIYDENSIPPNLILAQMWLGYYINKGYNPSDPVSHGIKREMVDVLEIEYSTNDSEGSTNRVSLSDLPNAYAAIQHLIKEHQFTDASNSDSGGRRIKLSGRTYRA